MHIAYLVLVCASLSLDSFPLPSSLLSNLQFLATGQECMEVDSARYYIGIAAQEALVEDAQVGVARDKSDGDNGVNGVGACLLRDSQEDGGDMMVVPAGTGLFGVAGTLPATGQVSKHVVV